MPKMQTRKMPEIHKTAAKLTKKSSCTLLFYENLYLPNKHMQSNSNQIETIQHRQKHQKLIYIVFALSSDLTHVFQFVVSFVTAVTIRYSFSLPLQAQNSSFPQFFPPYVQFFCLSTYSTDSTDSSCFCFIFSSMSVLTLALCARLSWLIVRF